jgi:small subunit ribosomal protein S1
MHVEKKQFHTDAWPEVYASRQTGMILRWPAVAVEEHHLRVKNENGDTATEKVLCLAVARDGVKGIIPLPETGVEADRKFVARARLVQLLGQEVPFVVVGIDADAETFTGSRKQALEIMSRETWASLKPGVVKTAVARRPVRRRLDDGSVKPLGFIVDLDGVEALLPVWELSHGWVDEMQDFVQPGDVFDVKVLAVDKDRNRVTVSVKELVPNPWPGAAKKYVPGGYYAGTVTGVARYGVFVSLPDPGVDALCRHMKGEIPKKGDLVLVVVTEVAPRDESGQVRGRVLRILRRGS